MDLDKYAQDAARRSLDRAVLTLDEVHADLEAGAVGHAERLWWSAVRSVTRWPESMLAEVDGEALMTVAEIRARILSLAARIDAAAML